MIKDILRKLKSDTNLKELVSGSAITFVLKIFGMFIAFLLVYIISKKGGSEAVGYYSLLNQLILSIGTILCLGTNFSILRYIGQYASKEPWKIKVIYKRILFLLLPINAILGSVWYFFGPQISMSLDFQYDFPAIWVLGLVFPFFILTLLHLEFVRGIKKIATSEVLRSVIRPLVMLILILVYWQQSLNAYNITNYYILSIITAFIISVIPVWKYLKRTPSQNTLVDSKRGIAQTSLPMMITGVTPTFMTAITLFIIERYMDTGSVGIFSVAMRFTILINIVLVVVNTIAAPKFAELYWAKRSEELQKVIRQSSKIMFWISLLATLFIILTSNFLLGLFGEEYQTARDVLVILSVGQFINVSSGSVGIFLNMTGNQSFLRNTAVMSILISLILSILLIPSMGLTGAAISTIVTSIIWNVVNIIYTQRKLGIKTYYLPFVRR